MRVLFDVSVLGAGHVHNLSRTGIFRVAEKILFGLIEADECSVSLCASGSHLRAAQAQLYCSANPHLDAQRFVTRRYIQDLSLKLYTLHHRSLEKSEHGLGSYFLRGMCFYIMMSLNVFPPRFRRDRLSGYNIFHSPFYPLPDETRSIRGLKRFLTIYDLIPLRFPHYFAADMSPFLKTVVKSIHPEDWVFAISESTKNDLCEHLQIDGSRVVVNHLAASPELFYPCLDERRICAMRRKYNIPEAPYFLGLNTLEPRKNTDRLIRAFSKMVREHRIEELSLVLVGSKGWKYDPIFDAIEESGLARNRIVLTGFVDDEDLATFYSGALCFVYPSQYEGFGLPPLEAMQCGTPVITSNSSSLPEVVGNAGIMIDPDKTDELCQAMLDVYRSSALRDSLSVLALHRSKQFSWERFVKRTIEAYKLAVSA